MKRTPMVWALALMLCACSTSSPKEAKIAMINIPKTRTVDVSDTYHGTVVKDPYRWLEDDNAPETKAWVEEQNAITAAYLAQVPARQEIEARLTELWDYPRSTPPTVRKGRYFFLHNEGLQNQAAVLMSAGREGVPQLVIDPNTWSADGTVAMSFPKPNELGTQLAYGVSTAGSDWTEIRFFDVDQRSELSDRLKWVKFSEPAWMPDGRGVFYSRYPEPKAGEELQAANYHQKLYFHRLRTTQAEDTVIYERPDQPEWGFGASVTTDSRYAVITAWVGTDSRNRVFLKDLMTDGPVLPLLTDFDGSYEFIGSEGDVFYFKADAKAPRGRVIAVRPTASGAERIQTVVPETQATLSEVALIAGRFVLVYMQDVHHRLETRALDGSPMAEIALPGIGTVSGLSGRPKDEEAFFAFTSFTIPTTTYRVDFVSGRCEVFKEPRVAFNPDLYEARQVWYTSRDGTRIPMFIVHKKGLAKNGQNPTILYGYGGFNIPITPGFSVPTLVWMEMGGIYASPALRGGSEYGEEWHRSGMLAKKQNVFDDFITAAEHLISEGYTSPKKLAISGGSNGGLLVGACMTQRPDLFGACLPAVGVMDMLRFHKFTIGWAWVPEFGSADNPEQFQTLYAYSPLHRLMPGAHYPATLITTADHDDRVVPAHSFKFAAALQAAQAGPAPCLIRIETKAGHGAGAPISKLIEEVADKWAFLTRALGMQN